MGLLVGNVLLHPGQADRLQLLTVTSLIAPEVFPEQKPPVLPL